MAHGGERLSQDAIMSAPRRCIRQLGGLALCLWAGACRSGSTQAPLTTRDSAGLAIIESSSPEWAEHPPWRLGAEPRLTIGTAEGSEEYQLNWIWDAIRLQSGVIVIGNAGSQELRFYDSMGTFIRSAGRKGEGPGEFGPYADLRMWRLPGGVLAVRDAPMPRNNLFDTTGAFLRTVTLAVPPGAARPATVGAFADGTLLEIAYESEEGTAPGEVVRSAVRYFRYSQTGASGALLSRVQSAPRYVHQAGNVVHYPYLPFAVEPVMVADSATVLLLRDGNPELERLDLEGRPIARIRWQPKRRPVTAAIYKGYVSADLARASNPEQKRLYEALYRLTLPLPDFVPAYRDLYIDDTRHIWVERYRLPGEAERVWDVLDPGGRWLGPVTLPGRFWLHRAGADYLLGTQMDSLDVERMQLYSLVRPRR
jgi:hypothetical protein